ncbi:leucine-rich repeat domain-containing protein, partial [Treponema sp. R6D11]
MDITLHAKWDTIFVFTNSNELSSFLTGQPINTPSNPYIIKLNIDDSELGEIKGILDTNNNKNKYIYLDLSDSSIAYIADHAFSNCNSLTEVTLPNNIIGFNDGVFEGCANLVSINVSNNSAYSSIDGVLYDKTGSALIAYPSGKTGDFTIPSSVNTIGAYAFPNCSKLTSVTIPDSVTDIKRYAFHSCTGLT